MQNKPDWRVAERRFWTEALAAPADSDAAVRSMQDEGRPALEMFGSLRRVLAAAVAPGPHPPRA